MVIPAKDPILGKKWVTSIITPIVLKENDRTIVRIAFLNIDGSI